MIEYQRPSEIRKIVLPILKINKSRIADTLSQKAFNHIDCSNTPTPISSKINLFKSQTRNKPRTKIHSHPAEKINRLKNILTNKSVTK